MVIGLRLTTTTVRSRRLPHPDKTALRHRACTSGIGDIGWIVNPQSNEDGEASTDWVGCVGDYGVVGVWEGVFGHQVGGGHGWVEGVGEAEGGIEKRGMRGSSFEMSND